MYQVGMMTKLMSLALAVGLSVTIAETIALGMEHSAELQVAAMARDAQVASTPAQLERIEIVGHKESQYKAS